MRSTSFFLIAIKEEIMNDLLKQQILEVRKMRKTMHKEEAICNGIVVSCNKCAFRLEQFVCILNSKTKEEKGQIILNWLMENDTNIYKEE
jgi:hypothetical protein